MFLKLLRGFGNFLLKVRLSSLKIKVQLYDITPKLPTELRRLPVYR